MESNLDPNFAEELRKFFKKNWEYKIGSADDFMIEFQEFIKEKGFDLTSVLQWRKV